MATKQGKIISVPVLNVIEGQIVIHKNIICTIANSNSIEIVTKKGAIRSWVMMSELRELVVEYFEVIVNSHAQSTHNVKLPLKLSQWEAAINNNEVNSGIKQVKFEIIERKTDKVIGYHEGNLNNPIHYHYIMEIAKVIPNREEKLTLEQKIIEILKCNIRLPFLEFYPHEHCDCFKILNPYTKYGEEKLVLCREEESFEKAIDIALPYAKKWYQNSENI